MLGLVVEGGANRTYYSIGVLDAFIDYGIKVDFMVGVSAGIANATSYISGQRGRSLELGLKYIPDKRYMGLKYIFKKDNRSYYNRDFIFNNIPNNLVPFDYDSFKRYSGKVYAVVTNLDTGKPEYLPLDASDKSWCIVQASCALPLMFAPVKINGKEYFDGGCSDPLPVKFAFQEGCDKIITILSREESYQKHTETDAAISAFIYRKKSEFSKTLTMRSDIYNDSRSFLHEKQKEGSAFVFCPKTTAGWSRTEKNPSKLQKMYDEGYNDAVSRMDELKQFMICE